MPFQATILKLTFCAPGDVVEEIKIAASVVTEWNLQHGEARGLFVKHQHWQTDAYPEAGDRPQAIINRQLIDAADIIVALFWSKFGSPTGAAESGTEEEIRRSIAARKKVMVYFLAREIPTGPRDEAELAKINQFKRDYADQGIYWVCGSAETFKQDFTRHLAAHLNSFNAEDAAQKQSEPKTSRPKEIRFRDVPIPERRRQVNQTVVGTGNVVAGGDVIRTEKVVRKNIVQPGPEHLSNEQKVKVKELIDELVEIDVKAGKDDTHRKWWSKLNKQFHATTYHLILAEDYESVIAWARKQLAMATPKLRRTDNAEWRNRRYRGIWARARQNGLDDEAVYQLAYERLGLRKPIASLKELGEQNLDRLYRIIMAF